MNSTHLPKSGVVEAACRTDFLSFFQWCFHGLEPGSTLNKNGEKDQIVTTRRRGGGRDDGRQDGAGDNVVSLHDGKREAS